MQALLWGESEMSTFVAPQGSSRSVEAEKGGWTSLTAASCQLMVGPVLRRRGTLFAKAIICRTEASMDICRPLEPPRAQCWRRLRYVSSSSGVSSAGRTKR